MRAAARAAIECGVPYAVTGSFDTAGRTMMGLAPSELADVFDGLDVQPAAIGANCGVGASDLLIAIQQIRHAGGVVIAKSNCGVPRFEGTEIVYSGDPAVMAKYAVLAVDSGARIIGGCCGTSPEHLAEMKRALDAHQPGPAPSLDEIVATVGPLANPIARRPNPANGASVATSRLERRSRPVCGAICLTWARRCLSAIRRSFDARVGLVGAPWRVDVERLAQAFHEALLGERPVARLAAFVVDDDPDLRPEAVDDALALHRTEGRRRSRDRVATRPACATDWRAARPVRPTARTSPAARGAGSAPSE